MSKKPVTSIDLVLTGKRIHNAILESGYSLREVKDMLHLKCSQPVYRWIHGYTLPSIDNLYGLSKILGVQIEDLLVERGAGDKVDKTE